MRKAEHKDIARIDQESKCTHGWYVRVRWQGITHSKFFADKKHGGKQSALLAAIAWRDKVRRKVGKPVTNKHIVSVSCNTISKSGTGVVGVRLNEKLNRYEVSWVTPHGKQGKTSVSISKHGKKAAFAEACRIRQRKEADRLAAAA